MWGYAFAVVGFFIILGVIYVMVEFALDRYFRRHR